MNPKHCFYFHCNAFPVVLQRELVDYLFALLYLFVTQLFPLVPDMKAKGIFEM